MRTILPIMLLAALGSAHQVQGQPDETPLDRQQRLERLLWAARSDKTIRRIAWSGRICWFRQLHSWAKNEIVKEHKYGRESGAIDLTRLHGLGASLREAGSGERKARRLLGGVKPLSCRDERVEAVRWCLNLEESSGVDENGVIVSGQCDQPEALLASSDEE
jgi:hypothetical protein